MIRAVLALLAFMVAGVFEAPIVEAGPQVSDRQFCQAVEQEMDRHQETAGIRVSDCTLVSDAGKGSCNYLASSQDFIKTVEGLMQTWNWTKTIAAIVAVDAVGVYCPENGRYLPQSKQAPPPPSGNVGMTTGLVV
ncbi:hypothetical protein A5747_13215 [Mycobacterium sp. IS-836]|uniref:DUF732 domain-containing protein n=1 Tax=Mycobacterium sp. IS-836 TaxID=1834160 RepID=UPI00096CD814|nr:DUF732 domain-containing protein [Mycobacterium sp. IS-836]OMC55349.1 hypothetical protein A5747_13215 [Mycobacterium sp. IS-836]